MKSLIELRKLSVDKLNKQLEEERHKLFNLKLSLSNGDLKNSSEIKFVQRQISRIITLITEAEHGKGPER